MPMGSIGSVIKVVVLGIVLIPVGMALADWGSVKGNGHAKSESRPLAGFTQVVNETSVDVDIAQGDHFEVQVTTDENLLPVLLTTVEGTALRIHADQSFSSSAKSVVRVVVPSLSGVHSAGSGRVVVHGLSRGEPLELKIVGSGALSFDGSVGDLQVSSSGSGSTTLRGKAGKVALDLQGSGAINAAELSAMGAKVALSGNGAVSLSVTGDLSVDDHGSGSVRASVNGGTVDVKLMGSGSVEWTGTAHEGKIIQLGSGRVVHRGA
jgi:hypothetical protein